MRDVGDDDGVERLLHLAVGPAEHRQPTKRAISLKGSTTATIATPASTAQRIATSARSDWPASTRRRNLFALA